MKKNHKLQETLKKYWILIISGIIVQLIFVTYSKFYYETGFPLDDSWIHQTYARNLLQYGGWFYNLNEQSAGSTAPLWTVLLIPGHLLKNFYFLWTILISGIIYIFSAIIFQKIFEIATSNSQKKPWVGILFLLEWHIVWLANSGMETILFILMILSVFYLLLKESTKPDWLLFIILGMIVFVRPDGITLIGPFLFIYFINLWKLKFTPSTRFYMGLLVILILFSSYAIFNYLLAGEILPNTFFAKQAEYQMIYSAPLVSRFLNLLLIPITGVGIVLLPGFIYILINSIKCKDVPKIAMLLWLFGYILIYAVRLPVTYQHGRYIIPTIPVFLLLSIIGTFEIIKSIEIKNRIYSFGYRVLIALTTFVFLALGIKAYANDVAIIQTEMVETAQWVNENLNKDAILAAHDIGALGFFSNRKIIDLAGLISPEVIPFLRDEIKLANYLNENNVNYVIAFPNWYDGLVEKNTVIFSTESKFAVDAGGENMKIYIWK